MAYYRARGVDLTNAKDGGDGADPGEETRAKMSAAKQGKPAHNRGKATPEAARRKQSEAAKRRWEQRTPEEKEAVTQHLLSHAGTGKSGWHHSEEARAKISASLKGNKRTFGYKVSEETRRRRSEARKGYRFTQEDKNKIGMAKARFSPEQVQEIRRLLAEGMTQKAVAERFGVHRVTISRIQHGQSYVYYD
jgi:DNA invertase Pin-like site-specific DNA recombinase